MDLQEAQKLTESIIYLDNAATVFPKPSAVMDRMVALYKQYGVNPGRSGYDLCLVGGDLVEECRAKLAAFFGGRHPERLCFAYNASAALNLLIQGMAEPRSHVISTVVEHNSTIRPLNHLVKDGKIADVTYVPSDDEGYTDPDAVARAFRPETRLVVVNHGSNVIGTIQPVAELGRIAHEHGARLILDTAQTAGVVPIDVAAMNVDALAFTGHKSLLGPTGIGGLYVREGVEVRHTCAGGTGVESAHPYQLEQYPYRLEIGTGNVLGIVGLYLAQQYIEERGLDAIYRHEMEIFAVLQEGVAEIPGVHLHGTRRLDQRLPVLSLTVDGLDPSDVGTMLDADYNIACRTGLQCAPLIHDRMGTSPRGTVRLSVGPMNQLEHVQAAVRALREIAAIGARRT